MTTVKCPCCGTDVKIPADIDEAANKWNARKESQRKTLQDKRAEDPDYGKPEIYKIEGGSIMYCGTRLVLVDDFHIELLKSGEWRGWANLDWRSLMFDPTMPMKLQNNYTANMIELGENGPTNNILSIRFHDAPRRPRLEFAGIGELKLKK